METFKYNYNTIGPLHFDGTNLNIYNKCEWNNCNENTIRLKKNEMDQYQIQIVMRNSARVMQTELSKTTKQQISTYRNICHLILSRFSNTNKEKF